jgi:hypothetical protein
MYDSRWWLLYSLPESFTRKSFPTTLCRGVLMSVMCSSMTLSVSCITGLPIVSSSGGASPLNVMLMLRGVVFSDVLRTTSGVGAGMPKLRGSVFGVALSGAGAAFAAAGGWATGGSRVAAPGVSDG